MKIAIGSDRRGFEYKEELKKYLAGKNFEILDLGTYDDEIPVDYPIYGKNVGECVANGKCDKGILICATGIGIMIACNKVKGIRCGMGYTDEAARLMREHNDANVIAFGQSQMSLEDVKRRTDIFLTTDFLAGYHSSRVEQISRIENEQELHQTPLVDQGSGKWKG